jgi:anti-sigma B factor antagonist
MAASPAVPNPELRLDTEKKEEEIVVHGAGRINSATSNLFQNTIRELIPQNKRIVLDLTRVEHIDSTGLGALVSVYLAAGRADCVLELANPKQRLRDLFKMTKVDSIFGSYGEYHFGGF